ncbi:glycogen debranching protein [Edaphobacter aggregans]|uniref:glycogen debranching protein n=1 Tax=Edaphobacter aggregans TaxID=570835 RepID=UPI00068DCC35|nr:isoamylase [Edaphobacter aggregans]
MDSPADAAQEKVVTVAKRSNWARAEGIPLPHGVTWIESEQAFNFAVYSEHAESVTLLLYSATDLVNPVYTYRFDFLRNKSGRVWHCRIPVADMGEACYYAYSVSGPTGLPLHTFDPQKILLDPYAKCIFFPSGFDRTLAIREGSNAGGAPLGALAAHRALFDWEGDQLQHHESDAIIYELHVKGFTQNPNSGVDSSRAGTYAGLVEKIPYLKELGVTVVELMPVFQRDPHEGDYWGYMPLNFFAPHAQYASCCRDDEQHLEFRNMVKALHGAGIGVVLDVVFNHTSEGDENGPIYSYKGFDGPGYYMRSSDPASPYANYSGTGNTLNFDQAHVRKLVMDSLRYWRREMHIDGFRFDLASVFSRNADGSLNCGDAPIFNELAADPELGQIRLIAEPWDTGAYQLGRGFPGVTWHQWNGRFRDDIRRFVKGDPGLVPDLMRRIYGSDDLFPDSRAEAYHAYQSVNYITSHDGFTLYDLVSYDRKHNWKNGHNNQDGMDDNYSWNCGHEGDEGAPESVLALRRKQVKNFCCLLLLSNGVPMFRAGDEFLNTQHGNNNPYNQDNETGWLDWNQLRANQDIFRFFKGMIAFRKNHPSLSRSRFWREDVSWYGTGRAVDLSHDAHSLAFCLHGASQKDDDIYVMINAYWEPLTFSIQEGTAREWRRVVDTGLSSPDDFSDRGVSVEHMSYQVAPRSIVVFTRVP